MTCVSFAGAVTVGVDDGGGGANVVCGGGVIGVDGGVPGAAGKLTGAGVAWADRVYSQTAEPTARTPTPTMIHGTAEGARDDATRTVVRTDGVLGERRDGRDGRRGFFEVRERDVRRAAMGRRYMISLGSVHWLCFVVLA